jgi:hypothetical protein
MRACGRSAALSGVISPKPSCASQLRSTAHANLPPIGMEYLKRARQSFIQVIAALTSRSTQNYEAAQRVTRVIT